MGRGLKKNKIPGILKFKRRPKYIFPREGINYREALKFKEGTGNPNDTMSNDIISFWLFQQVCFLLLTEINENILKTIMKYIKGNKKQIWFNKTSFGIIAFMFNKKNLFVQEIEKSLYKKS